MYAMSDKSPDSKRDNFELREQDKWLPIANVSRIMKNALPDNAKVSKEAKECVQECVSEFVSFITSEASEKCSAEKRKTVNGEDILFAMTSLGFENYSEVLKIYLAKYREYQLLKQEKEGNRKGSSANDEEDEEQPANPRVKAEEYKTDSSYGYEGSFNEDGPDEAIYEEYSGQYTNVDGEPSNWA